MIDPDRVHADFEQSKDRLIHDFNLSDPNRPVDNYTLIVGGDAERGRVDFITRWEPGHYCTFHRHLGDTISIVLEGEHWVEKPDGTKNRRLPGHYACTPAGEFHHEFGGPEGSVVFFSIHSADGDAFQSLNQNGEAVSQSTVKQLLSQHSDS
ncbi:MAG: hypothetical protein KUG65_07100 [Sphingomonadaceae bacterium]|nr:hypothetical protein [Sphingomonadaceae bacterium]